jgi:hypothetical protein
MSQLIRRAIFWSIVAVMVVTLICGMIEADKSTTNPVPHIFVYIYTLQAAFVALAIWSIIYVHKEPVLVRVALVIMVVTSYGALWIHKL